MREQIRGDDAAGQLFARQIAQTQAEIVHAVGRARAIILREALRSLFDFGDCIGVKQLAEVCFAQQFAQLILIDGESLRAALGQRGEPAYVKEIAETIAPVKQCTLAELSAATSRTARDFFARLT